MSRTKNPPFARKMEKEQLPVLTQLLISKRQQASLCLSFPDVIGTFYYLNLNFPVVHWKPHPRTDRLIVRFSYSEGKQLFPIFNVT